MADLDVLKKLAEEVVIKINLGIKFMEPLYYQIQSFVI